MVACREFCAGLWNHWVQPTTRPSWRSCWRPGGRRSPPSRARGCWTWSPWKQHLDEPAWPAPRWSPSARPCCRRSCTGPTHLGLGDAAGGDRAFEQMVLTRLIEPTSKAQVPHVLDDLDLETVSVRTLFRPPGTLRGAGLPRGDLPSPVRVRHRHQGTGPVPAGVTTLYFEAERGRPAAGGLLARRGRSTPRSSWACWSTATGSPLQVGCWEGNRAETTTITPSVEAFQAAHGIGKLVIVNGRRNAVSIEPERVG